MAPLSSEAKFSLVKRAQNGEKVAKLCREAGVSRKTFYSWLKKIKGKKANVLKTHLADKRFKSTKRLPILSKEDKLLAVNKYLAKSGTCVEIAKSFGISRKTLYKWVARYQKYGEEGLLEARIKGEEHYRAIGEEKKGLVLDVVSKQPGLSVHKIYAYLKEEGIKIGHHAIQNLLSRENLNTFLSRRLFSGVFAPRPQVTVAPLFEPTMPDYNWKRILLLPAKGLFRTVIFNPRHGIPYAFGSLFGVFVVFKLLAIIFTTPEQSPIGLFFSSIALFFGIFFLIYSMKYYLTILMVLKLAQSGGTANESANKN